MPNRISPRMIGSTEMSCSLSLSHSTTRTCGAGFVGSLKTSASTRYLTARPSTPTRSERRILSRGMREASRPHPHSAEARTHEPVLAAFDDELLPRLNAVLLSKLGG